MALRDTSKIDSIDVYAPTSELVLSIFDDLVWSDPDHLQLLQSKINHYLAFICDGQLSDEYSQHADRKIRIQIAAKFEPNWAGNDFLDRARAVLLTYNVALNVWIPGDPQQ